MSLETANLGIMSTNTFIARTKSSVSVCGLASAFKSRGSNMREIDTRLRTWEKVQRGHEIDLKILCVTEIELACRQWIQRKRGKTTPLSEFRRPVVTEVMVAARNARQFLGNKQAPGRLGTKSLDDHGGYNKERQHFLNIGKAHNPIAASGAAHEVLSGGTQQQYEALPSSPDKLVNYFRRDSRLSMMAFIEGGRFYVGVAPISCTVEDYGGPCVTAWVYAVDRHGSMFVYDFFNADRDGRLMGYFNHSSFCAGREVMTAGTVVFLDGTLKYISNASGHYKPDANHLRNYLVLLGQEGVDLGGVAVEDIMRGTFRGSSILRNPGCAPDWPVTAKFHNKTGKIGVQHNGMTYRVQQPAG